MRTIILIAIAATVVGCKPEKPSTEDRSREARARVTLEAEAAEPAADAVPDQAKGGLTDEQRASVVARIGEFEITLGDVERQLASQPAFARARYRAFDKKVEFLNNMVQFELLAMEAHRAGYDTHPDVVLAMKRAMIQKFTATDLQKMVTASAITDTDIKTYYDNNKSSFQKAAQVRASHILFEDEATAAKSLAELAASIKADPARARVVFSDFTRRLSKDPDTVHKNGDIGFFTATGYTVDSENKLSVPQALVNAAFGLDGVNALSRVVKTEAGWHVLQVTNRRPAVNRTVEDAKRQITNVLLRERKDGARDKFIGDLRAKSAVKIFDEPLKQLEITKLKRPDGPAEVQPGAHHKRPSIVPVNPAKPTAPTQPTQPAGVEKPALAPSAVPPSIIPPTARPTSVLKPPGIKPVELPEEARQKKPESGSTPQELLQQRMNK
jgi:peptidyl-prolyl cis-trans isomerase C